MILIDLGDQAARHVVTEGMATRLNGKSSGQNIKVLPKVV